MCTRPVLPNTINALLYFLVLSCRAGWEVGSEEIEVCKRPDGTEWLLGEGRYGKVYKALKGGVQASTGWLVDLPGLRRCFNSGF